MENNTSRVLIVDDMLANRIILSSLLASNGVSSDQVETGMDCINMCEQNRYDLILLDHRMPDMDGVDTLVRLKDIFRTQGRSTPVVCHTTEEGRSNINLYKAAGFADVLIKPIDPKQLSEILLTYLAKQDETIREEQEKKQQEQKEKTEVHVRDEVEKLPLWLKNTPLLDLVQGVTNCETAEDYMETLTVFAASIKQKTNEILNFYEKKDWEMYTMRVHSLKSVSALIGARKLSELAASMEKAGKDKKYNTILDENRYLMEEYRAFQTVLSPLIEDKTKKNEPEEKEQKQESAPEFDDRCVLFIEGISSISNKGLAQKLQSADFTVIRCDADPGKIIKHRASADIVIYYPGDDDKSRITVIMNHLGEMCRDDNKILCLVGESSDLEFAMSLEGADRVSKIYRRPVNIDAFVDDIDSFALIEKEYHKKKSIFVVDDDPDFLKIMDHWLFPVYNVYLFSTGEDAIDGLSSYMPDLLLLDYEMPGMNGYELMNRIKSVPETNQIPIIFLTGKNDKEHVFKILENKPDGYLLKSSQKESLLDAISRFFAESAFKASMEV
ncbi:response regulator [Butyrivibrio sp. XPD2002]|uniref:response regulator n=1 Tax=Butyrivibrio sp. XPD2002 TaxID=1280665 RepID=UPI00041B8B86|nr:response regulator [Butyrivibrio sp. XPD2002]